jgi:phage terminase large subunit-like protein
MIVGISTPGWEKDSLAYRLYQHGKKVQACEIDDPTFFFRCWEPSDPEAEHTDPKVWAEANPSLGAFLNAEDFAAAVASTDENEFRRFRLGQWTSTHSAAFASGVWDAAAAERDIPDGTECMVAFVAARQRDTIAIVGATLDSPHIFPIMIWEQAERVDPSDVAEELRSVWGRFNVREFLCSEHDWSWVLLELAEGGLPITKVPRSPQRLALRWQQFYDAVLEHRLSHDCDRVLARHVSNLSLISGPSGPRPDLDVAEGHPVAAALAAVVAYDGVARIEPAPGPMVVLPSSVGRLA